MAESKLAKLWASTAWLGALAGALVLALTAAGAVYLVMSRQYGERFDKAVQASVDEQVAAMAQAPQGAPPTAVVTAEVRQETVQNRVRVIGRLRPVRRATVASQVEGRVQDVRVDVGSELVGGETVIAVVDDVWAKLAVEQAEADLSAAEARAAQSARELAHLQTLAQRNASDQRAIDDARAAADADAAEVLAYSAALHRAQETVDRVTIVAPFDGVVTNKIAEVGQWLEPGGSVVEILSTGEIDAVVDVPELRIGAVRIGMEIDVEVEATGQTLTGTVVALNPDGGSAARTFPVKIRLDNTDGALKVGMSAVALVPVTEMVEHVLVPRDAVSFTPQGAQVWITMVMPGSAADALPVAMPIDVNVLFGQGGNFAVQPLPKMEGMTLASGMSVVVEGAEQLWPTRPVIIGAPPTSVRSRGGSPVAQEDNEEEVVLEAGS